MGRDELCRNEDDPRACAEKVIGRIRTALMAEGGDITLRKVSDGVVEIGLTGPFTMSRASVTLLAMGIERALKEEVAGFTLLVTEISGEANRLP